MKIDITKLVHSLNSEEINILLRLYYYQNEVISGSKSFEKETLDSLIVKNLISVNIESNRNIVDLTDYGLSVCESIMNNRVNENSTRFQQKIKKLPERAVACFINRILWKDVNIKENGLLNPFKNPFAFDDNIWYERVLLNDKRIVDALEQFYSNLEDLGLIENINGQRWCSPEVENYLKTEYKKIMDLSGTEEESLKFYFFFYVYAKEQRNVINFSSGGEQYRAIFYEDDKNLNNYYFSSDNSDPTTLLSKLGLNEKRFIEFFEEMQNKEIVVERYYFLYSSSFFINEEMMFIIKDITRYMDYINNKFLKPVVDSLLN